MFPKGERRNAGEGTMNSPREQTGNPTREDRVARLLEAGLANGFVDD